MDFNPHHPIVQLCMRGMAMEEKGRAAEARQLFTQAWEQATDDFEKYLAAWFLSRHQDSVLEELHWLETALAFANKIDDPAVNAVYPVLYTKMAGCYEALGNTGKKEAYYNLVSSVSVAITDKGPFYHGTRADLRMDDLLVPGNPSNYKQGLNMNHIYFTALPNGAGLAAALAKGEGAERVYIVEPTGIFENDPNVTNQKFPGNPTRSYRTDAPLKITGELKDWKRVTPGELQQWRDKLANNKGTIIN